MSDPISTLQQQLEDAYGEMGRLRAERDQARAELAALRKKYDNLRGSVAGTDRKRVELQRELDSMTKMAGKAVEELAALRREVEEDPVRRIFKSVPGGSISWTCCRAEVYLVEENITTIAEDPYVAARAALKELDDDSIQLAEELGIVFRKVNGVWFACGECERWSGVTKAAAARAALEALE